MSAMNQEDLEALVAASRAGSAEVLGRLPALLASLRQLLAQLEAQGKGVEEQDTADEQEALLLSYRVARNAAATCGAPAVDALLSLGLLEAVRATLHLLSTATISLNWQLPAAVAQALANLATASPAGAAGVWAALFPLHLSMLAHVNAGPTQGATSLALLACCRAVQGAAAALAGPQGGQLMTALLCNHQRMLQQGEHNDNLCLLAAHLAFAQDLLPQLFDALGTDGLGASSGAGSSGAGSSSLAAGGALQPTMAQAALLQALAAEAHDMPQAPGEAGSDAEGAPRPAASMRFLVRLSQQLAAASGAAPRGLSSAQQQVLQECLHLQRDICARDDGGVGLAGGASLVAELQAAGFLPALLAKLKALAPIQNPRQQQQQQQEAGAGGGAAEAQPGSGGGVQIAELAPQLAQQAAAFPAQPPYAGYRTDLLAVISNAAHGRPEAEVQRLGGVELVLAQCQLDRESPLAREWALWGVRNLCEGNPAAQEAIRQLQLCTTVDNEELQRLGVKLELDEATGKLRVSKREGRPAAAPANS